MSRALVALFIFAQIADLVTFFIGARILPIADELNPLIRWVLTTGGEPAVIAFKMAGVAVILLLVRLRPVPAGLWFGALVGAIGFALNSASVLVVLP